jgi:hypothetical protein
MDANSDIKDMKRIDLTVFMADGLTPLMVVRQDTFPEDAGHDIDTSVWLIE